MSQLLRSITVPAGTLPVDPDWASDPALTPPAPYYDVPKGLTSLYVYVRAFDVGDNEISLGAMQISWAPVLRMDGDDGSQKWAELAEASAQPAKKLFAAHDLPLYAIQMLPRITSPGTSVPAAMTRLEFWVGGIE